MSEFLGFIDTLLQIGGFTISTSKGVFFSGGMIQVFIYFRLLVSFDQLSLKVDSYHIFIGY